MASQRLQASSWTVSQMVGHSPAPENATLAADRPSAGCKGKLQTATCRSSKAHRIVIACGHTHSIVTLACGHTASSLHLGIPHRHCMWAYRIITVHCNEASRLQDWRGDCANMSAHLMMKQLDHLRALLLWLFRRLLRSHLTPNLSAHLMVLHLSAATPTMPASHLAESQACA